MACTSGVFGRFGLVGAVTLLSTILGATAVPAEEKPGTLTDLSLEELLRVEVTSVSREREPLQRAAAAVYVIDAEDIRRSGATSIPDVLRMAPGVQVARVESNSWAISIRGFNEQFSNKLLVLIDGRSVYTPLFSGVLWDIHNVPLDNIERIEVIRGPGASLWGANAVHGIINIITKTAADVQGGFARLAGGNEERGHVTLRHGGALGDFGHYSVHASGFARDGGADPVSGDEQAGDWQNLDLGVRADLDFGDDRIMLTGGAFLGEVESRFNQFNTAAPGFFSSESQDMTRAGMHLHGRWSRTLGAGSEMALQGYYQYWNAGNAIAPIERHTLDVDFQHAFDWGGMQRITWGAAVRGTMSDVDSSPEIDFNDVPRYDYSLSAFLQDRIALVPDELDLIVGSKLEYDSFGGFEAQPSLRMAWSPAGRGTLWGAVSRAVRTPSQAEQDADLIANVIPAFTPLNPGPLPVLATIDRNGGFDSEELITFEAGWRGQLSPTFGLDLAAFYTLYDDIRGSEVLAPRMTTINGVTFLETPTRLVNNVEGHGYGLELVANWQVVPTWRLQSTYSYLRIDLEADGPGAVPLSFEVPEDSSPRHQAGLRSHWDITANLALDAQLKYVGRLRSLDVDDYVDLDLRLAWRPSEDLELGLVGRGLLHGRRMEFATPTFRAFSAVDQERSIHGYLTVRF